MTFGDKVEINNLISFSKILKEKNKLQEIDFHNRVGDIFKKVINEEIETSYVDGERLILNNVKSYEEGVLSALSVNYSEYVNVTFTHNLNHATINNFREFINEYLHDLAK